MSAAGRVCTGYSQPWVGLYDPENDSYSSQQELARGVSVDNDIEEADSNDFHANNVVAESVKGKFGKGNGKTVVDGLLRAAEKLIYGLPVPDADGFTNYDDDTEVPYVGFGYIMRYMSDGVTSYEATLLRKVKFRIFGDSAETQEEEINWQTQELEYDIYRANDAKHQWRRRGTERATEAEALADLKKALGVTP